MSHRHSNIQTHVIIATQTYSRYRHTVTSRVCTKIQSHLATQTHSGSLTYLFSLHRNWAGREKVQLCTPVHHHFVSWQPTQTAIVHALDCFSQAPEVLKTHKSTCVCPSPWKPLQTCSIMMPSQASEPSEQALCYAGLLTCTSTSCAA